MAASMKRILTVGLCSGASAILKSLERKGWECNAVETLEAGRNAIESGEFEIVLGGEQLADGVGYELIEPITRRAGTLLIALTLSESCVWIPVVERGARALGKRALHPNVLDSILEGFVSSARPDVVSSGRGRHPKRAKPKPTNPLHYTPQPGRESGAGLHQG